MSLENWVLLLTSLAAVMWPAVAVGVFAGYRRCREVLPERYFDSDKRRWPKVSVIIPARNEELAIESTLRGVLEQQGVQVEVIVVDDHSTDRTAEVVAKLSANDPRVRLLRRPPLRPGWLGKANAMAHGAEAATGDYLLFTDADVQHNQGGVSAAVHEMQDHQLSLLSFMPLFVWETIWENAAAPTFLLAIANFLSGPIHDPESDDALATGSFIMVEAEAYRALGGHRAIRGEMLDDVMLARYFKSQGKRVAFRAAPQCLTVRMYTGARSVFEGSIKNCLAIFGDNFWLNVPLSLTFTIGSVTVLAAPFVGLLLGNPTLAWLGVAVYFEIWLAVALARAYMKTDLLKLAGFVVGVPLLFAAAIVATYQAIFYGSVSWRGRAVRVTE